MKILKLPFDTTIKCECGCEFKLGLEDIEKEAITNFNEVNRYTYISVHVTCLLCGREYELIRKP